MRNLDREAIIRHIQECDRRINHSKEAMARIVRSKPIPYDPDEDSDSEYEYHVNIVNEQTEKRKSLVERLTNG